MLGAEALGGEVPPLIPITPTPEGGIAALRQGAVDQLAWSGSAWFVAQGDRDPATQAIVQRYLQRLQAAGVDPAQQGVWIQAGATRLAEHQGAVPLSAASLTKLVTSLAVLEQWGPNHQFVTEVAARGRIVGDTVQGDLVVRGGGDPFLVWEEAIAIGNTLQQMGIRRVTGRLIVEGNFTMNFLPDPSQPQPNYIQQSGQLFQQAIDSSRWSPALTQQFAQMPTGTPRPQVAIAGPVVPQPLTATDQRSAETPLLTHHSLHLLEIVQQMNVYSNNAIAENLARMLGGGAKTSQRVAQILGFPLTHMQGVTGSGLGQANRFSSQSITTVLLKLQADLAQPSPSASDPASGGNAYTIGDILPSLTVEPGTLQDRKMPTNVSAKTGSLWDVSALAGVLPTRDRGPVWFTIINRSPKLDLLRQEQDRLLNELRTLWGAPPKAIMTIAPQAPTFTRSRFHHSDRPADFLGNPARQTPLWPPQTNE
jgi:D-alanyl-D-alanine carboxypeptidase/D-alanyl-D-alanine-endopeptidase (penicillin-binding protein 4)